MANQPHLERAGSAAVIADLAAGQPVLSLGVRFSRTGDIARMAAGAGYRVVWIDLEHSSMAIDCAAQIAATATDLGLAAWVRVPERDLGTIGRLLDCGATGIIAPKIETVEEARAFAAACRFPPVGQRSMLATVPQQLFARHPAGEFTRLCNDEIAMQVLLESAAGIDNADAIAAVPGVDILGVGMNDLTADFGCPGEARDPRIVKACLQVAAAAKRHGKLAVVGGVANADHFAELLAAGFSPLIFAGIDTDVMSLGLSARAQEWNERLEKMQTISA